MADRVYMPRALDSNGDIVPAAKAYFYESGTTTPLTVYTTSDADIGHGTYVDADAAGVWPDVYTTEPLTLDLLDDVGASLPGFPSDAWHISPTVGAAAGTVTFSPVTGNPSITVQSAIEYLTSLWNEVTAFSRNVLTATNASGFRDEIGLGTAAVADLIDEDDLASDDDTAAPSQQSVKAYVDGWSYTSAEQSVTPSSTLSLAHGLGVAPSRVSMILRCKVADLGYSVGDEVIVGPSIDDNSANIIGPIVVIDAGSTTNVKIILTGNMVLPNKSTYSRGSITASSWALVVRANV